VPATPEDIRSSVTSYVERFNAGDREGWAALFAPDHVIDDPVGSPLLQGPDGAGTFWDNNHAIAPDAKLAISGPIVVVADEAAFPLEIQVSGVVIDVIDIMGFDDQARIRSLRAWWNLADAHPPAG
jgi:steroid delta-isomerase